MPEFQFYPSTGSGVALSLDDCRLDSDADAMLHAEVVLAAHESCSSVAVWTEDRLVMVIYRGVLNTKPTEFAPSRQESEAHLPA